MTGPTIEQAKQALNHLVTVEVATTDGVGNPFEATITGLLRQVNDFTVLYGGDEVLPAYQIDVTSGFRPGSYDDFAVDVVIGSPEGLTISADEIVSFTDHGARDDFDTNLNQLIAQREHALQALKDAEANLARAYAEVTNLTAQEG